jgi:hypothetical protein
MVCIKSTEQFQKVLLQTSERYPSLTSKAVIVRVLHPFSSEILSRWQNLDTKCELLLSRTITYRFSSVLLEKAQSKNKETVRSLYMRRTTPN